ncbi:MAG: sugar ABC transporter ATP-binding protein [Planctomycetota bacterium]|jgi:ABC-type sugar transport system ATPase subunit|nr:sugar ABC transporter ATP-binding protein [Planctomycetota bacterium]
MEELVLEARGITKRYPGTTALDDVDFDVFKGAVNVLVGENGAGKSTLTKILAGVEEATTGRILRQGKPIRYSSPFEARNHGVGIVFQELNLVPNLSIAENMFMAREIMRNRFMIDHERQESEAAEALRRLQLDLPPSTLVSSLGIGQQQIVELAKALHGDVDILIMDEPTSALSEQEVKVLFEIIVDLKARGTAIVYISHRFEEILEIGDYITVLRDGRLISKARIRDIDIHWIVREMTGEEEKPPVPRRKSLGGALLEVNHLRLPNFSGGYKVNDVSFKLRKGEILGIYGLMGAGRTELLECLVGAQPDATGQIVLEGREIASSRVDQRIIDGFSLIPEDRKQQGIVQTFTIAENMTLASLSRYTGRFSISSAGEGRAVDDMIRELAIKIGSKTHSIFSLSGGNQQKVVVGKNLLTNPRVLLMDEPTRGIDVGAKKDMFDIVRKLTDEGLGIIMVSSELKEMLTIPDRVLVLNKGRLTGEFDRSELSQATLLLASGSK